MIHSIKYEHYITPQDKSINHLSFRYVGNHSSQPVYIVIVLCINITIIWSVVYLHIHDCIELASHLAPRLSPSQIYTIIQPGDKAIIITVNFMIYIVEYKFIS